jgi:hypothetical protein
MNLNKISKEIIDSVNMNQNSYKATKDSIAEIIEKELKEGNKRLNRRDYRKRVKGKDCRYS